MVRQWQQDVKDGNGLLIPQKASTVARLRDERRIQRYQKGGTRKGGPKAKLESKPEENCKSKGCVNGEKHTEMVKEKAKG